VPADIFALINAKRDEVLAVAARYRVTNVRVSSSVARCEAKTKGFKISMIYSDLHVRQNGRSRKIQFYYHYL
jgi:hypothetical protein